MHSSRRLAGLLSLSVLAMLAACQNPREKADQKAQLAQDLFAAGNLYGAQQAITEAIQLRDDKVDYYLLQGGIMLRSGRQLDAFNAFNRALDLDGSNVAALSFIANLGIQVGRVRQADDAADRLLVLDPQSVPALQVKGMIALSKGQLDKAAGFADRILARNPTDEAGSIIRARALALDGKTDEALAAIDKTIAAVGPRPALLTNQLNIYRKLGQPQAMVPIFEKLVPLAGNNLSFRLDQINLLYKLGQVGPARAAGMALMTAGSSSIDDYITMRRIWDQFDQRPMAGEDVRTIAQSKDPLAVIATVRHLLDRGDVQTASAILSATPPRIANMVASLKARLLFLTGQEAAARQQVDAILARDSGDVDALLMRAQFSFSDGKANLAINDAQQAVAADPFNPDVYVVLSTIYQRTDNLWRARQIYEDGLKRLPQSYYLVERYISLLKGQGDKSRVISLATAFAKAQPSAVRAWELMMGQCTWLQDRACGMAAAKGMELAKVSYKLDETPGAPVNRGLFGPL